MPQEACMTMNSLHEAFLFHQEEIPERLTRVLAGCIHPSCTDLTLSMVRDATAFLVEQVAHLTPTGFTKKLQQHRDTLQARLMNARVMEAQLRSGRVSPPECVAATLTVLISTLKSTPTPIC
jgi:hypothetical protein